MNKSEAKSKMTSNNEKTCTEKGIKTGQKKSGQPPAKRTHSEVSTEELSYIHTQLDSMNENLSEVRGELKTLMKKEDIENLITSTVTTIMEKMEKKLTDIINRKINENTEELCDKIRCLEYENAKLNSKLDNMKSKIDQEYENLTEQYIFGSGGKQEGKL